jgi:glycosyltransferase involved in cell wall biosynthesis
MKNIRNQAYPKITLVTPSFNQGPFIEETIRSVLQQNYPNLQYIIIDGGSSDNTIDIIKKYESQLYYWISEPDRGMYDALNKGFAKSSGQILGWINSDDVFYGGALHKIADVFNKLDKVLWVTGKCGYIDRYGTNTRTAKTKIYNQELLTKGFYKAPYSYLVNQNAVFWRRELWEKVDGCDTNMKLAGDFALWTKFAKYTELYFIDYVFSAFRRHGKNLSNRIGVYADEAKPFINIKNTEIIKLVFGKQYYGYEILQSKTGEYSIRSVMLNPRYIRPLFMIKNVIASFIKTILFQLTKGD